MDREHWNQRYQSGSYTPREHPSELLSQNVDWFPDGRALDVATGTGRNALFLAEHGYTVDAIDISDVALTTASERATKRGVDVSWIHADIAEFDFPPNEYNLICVSFHYDLNLIPRLKHALKTGGILVYEHHLQPGFIADRGPSSDRYRFRSNDLLRACLDLTVLEYRERMHQYTQGERSGQYAAITSIIARNGLTSEPWYPPG